MTAITRLALPALLVACWRSEPAAPPPKTPDPPAPGPVRATPTCNDAVDNGIALALPDMRKLSLTDDDIAAIQAATLRRCKEDRWSEDSLTCMIEARADSEFEKCQDALSAEQQTNMQKAMLDVIHQRRGSGANAWP